MLIGVKRDVSGWRGGGQQGEELSGCLKSWDSQKQDLEPSHDGSAVSGHHRASGGPSPQ